MTRIEPRLRTVNDFNLDFNARLYESSLRAKEIEIEEQKDLKDSSNSESRARRESVNRRFTAEDFEVPFNDLVQVRDWFEKYPAISRRNFYVVQNHHATAKHIDLRFQLKGKTISFCIPKGLSEFPISTLFHSGIRQGIETSPHPINRTLFEGNDVGTTLCLDLGVYRVLETESARKRREDDPTDEDEEVDEDGHYISEDEREENKFHQVYSRAARIISPEQIILPAQASGNNSTRGFAIELNGTRYKGLRLTFSHEAGDLIVSRPKANPKADPVSKRRWLISLQNRNDVKSRGIESTIFGDKSILSDRTMEEIKANRNNELVYLEKKRFETGKDWNFYFDCSSEDDCKELKE